MALAPFETLEKAGLLKRVREEKVRNLTKAYFQAQAKSLWFSPKLVSERGAEALSRRPTDLVVR